MGIGQRLREERERLGLSQERFAAIGGVQKRAQINYEAGERVPDAAYLEGVAAAGVNVAFVVTGRSAGESLTPEEATMLGYFRAASPDTRRAALGALVGASPATAGNINIASHGQRGGVQIGYVAGKVTGPKSK